MTPTKPIAPADAGVLAERLATRGAVALARLGPAGLLDAWSATVAALRDPDSTEGHALRQHLRATSPLSPEGLEAALQVMLRGVDHHTAGPLIDAAHSTPTEDGPPPRKETPTTRGLVVISAAGNVPGLIVQPLLPALALGRPAILKSPTAEPAFAAQFVQSLVARAPTLEDAVAAVTWPGGDADVESALRPHVETFLAYGDADTIRDLRARWHDRLIAFGPKLSIAIISRDAIDDDPAIHDPVIDGLARDIALLDQRGCLSVQAVYTDGDPDHLTHRLARALHKIADHLPVGRFDPATALAVHRLRTTAILQGDLVADLDPALGTVVVDPDPTLRPSPGLRSVRVHPVSDLRDLNEILQPHRHLLQGATLAGASAWALKESLQTLGLSRLAQPGTLQHVDTTWHNGGRAPLDWLR